MSDLELLNVFNILEKTDGFETLVKLIRAAGLVQKVGKLEPITFFAPVDEAFEKLPIGELDAYFKPANKQTLKDLISYHIVEAKIPSQEVYGKQTVTTLQGKELLLEYHKGKFTVNEGAKVIKANIAAKNGLIHFIDGVLKPPKGYW
ncbi:MAG: fasciclin domain-containing protein [Candidatus Odinarchaeia archaeon]